MIRSRLLLAAVAATALTPFAAIAQPAPLLGFTPDGAAQERALEARFDQGISAAQQRDWQIGRAHV